MKTGKKFQREPTHLFIYCWFLKAAKKGMDTKDVWPADGPMDVSSSLNEWLLALENDGMILYSFGIDCDHNAGRIAAR